jgi:hypothetical protein
MRLNQDNRKVDFMEVLKSYLFPAIIAAVSSYMAVVVTLSTIKADVKYIKRDMDKQSEWFSQVTANQITLTSITADMANNDRWYVAQEIEIDRLKERVRILEQL